MKIKRIVLSSLLAAGCALSVAFTAFAATNEGEVEKNEVILSGYVSGVDWPLIMQDKIYYTASMYGSNAEYIGIDTLSSDNTKVFIRPYSDKKDLGKMYLWADRRRISGTDGASCGSGVKKVYLEMSNQGKTRLLESDLT